jgi:hypothetical protein
MENTLRIVLAVLTAALGLVVVVPILFGLLVLRGVRVSTRLLAKVLEPRYVSWPDLIEFWPAIGWRSKPNLDTHALQDDVFHLTTDADGWRGKETRLSNSDLVVFGDSHAFGHGIDDRYYFANLNRNLRVKAIGVSGYNMVQELLWMRELRNQLSGKVVVWFVFLGNDLLDNLEPSMMQYRTPFVRESRGLGQWEIVTEHVQAAPWPTISRRYRETNYDRLTQVFRPGFVSDRALASCAFLIAQGLETCEAAGARLVILSIPDPKTLSQKGLDLLYAHGADVKSFDPELPDKRLRTICEELGLAFIAGQEHLGRGEYKEQDDHWNAVGHRRIADLLKRLYEQHRSDCPTESVKQRVRFSLPMAGAELPVSHLSRSS